MLAVSAAVVGVLVLLCARRRGAVVLCVLGLTAALWLVGQSFSQPATPVRFDEHGPTLLHLDRLAAYMMVTLFVAALAVSLFAHDYFARDAAASDEFYLLLLLATFGGAVLAAATHFVSLFLGLEILSVSLYAMIAYRADRPIGIEGAIKYLVLTSVVSAVLLFGMALLYARWGTMELSPLSAAMASAGLASEGLASAGLAMLLVGVGFKLAWAPLHLWAGDVYHAAPAPTTAFVATVSKGAAFALLLRWVTRIHYAQHEGVALALLLVAGVSMCVGNLLALRADRLKRLLAYSSIAQGGYLLTAVLAGREWYDREGGALAVQAAGFYLPVYLAALLGAMGVVSVLARDASDGADDADHFSRYRGLFFRRPVLACVLTLMLLSLAGLPLTAGFVGKFLIVLASVRTGLWTLGALLVLNSAVSLYYSLRVAAMMCTHGVDVSPVPPSPSNTIRVPAMIVLVGITFMVLALGIYPNPLIEFIYQTVTYELP